MKKKFSLNINHNVCLEEFKQGNNNHIDDLFFLIQNKKNNSGKIIFEYKDIDQLNKIIEIIKSNY